MGAVILANGDGGVGLEAARKAVLAGKSPLDALEAGIRVVESNPSVRSVGFGGAPNVKGQMELEASIMCGATLRTGAVGALRDYLHAISVARQVMERTPHVMLVGEGAALFAAELGEQRSNLLSDEASQDYRKWVKEHVPAEMLAAWPDVPLAKMLWPSADPRTAHGTTCFLVRSATGNLAGGISTSGWAYKHPGRIGDSAIIGAGLYADNRFGAAACTHTGEMTIRSSTSRSVVLYMKKGATVKEACHEALNDLRALKGGHFGPVVIHALDALGNPYVLSTGNDGEVPFWFWRDGMEMIDCRRPVIEML